MRKFKLVAGVNYVDGEEYTLEELGLSEEATEEEINNALYNIVMEHLDWGWEEE